MVAGAGVVVAVVVAVVVVLVAEVAEVQEYTAGSIGTMLLFLCIIVPCSFYPLCFCYSLISLEPLAPFFV